MAGKPVRISILTDARDSVRGFDKAGAAAQDAGKKFDGAAEGADTVASKGAQAAGAMSGLGDLIGGKFGGAMAVAGVGMQAAADAGDLLNVAIEGGGKAAAKAVGFVKSLGKAETYTAAAKKVSAAAQWALNTAMEANPIGLVIAAIVALVAIFIIAYKKSETFRRIVDGAFSGVKRAASAVVGWIKSNFPKIFGFITLPFRTSVGIVIGVFGRIRDGATKAKDWVKEKFNALVDFFRGIPGKIGTATKGMWNGIKDSFRGAINTVIGWWNNLAFHLDLPDKIPGLPDEINIGTPNIPLLGGGSGKTSSTSTSGRFSPGSSGLFLAGRAAAAAPLNITLTLTAEQLSSLERGRRIEADRKTYLRSGGRAAS